MKILLLFLSLVVLLQENLVDYYIVYINHYRTPTHEQDAGLVLVFKTDSVRTYLPEVGYIWWKIDYKDKTTIDTYYNILETGEFKLSRGVHTSYLIVRKETVFQLIHLKGNPPVVFSVEMVRKTKMKLK